MELLFKTKKIEEEWKDPRLDPRVKFIIYAVMGFVSQWKSYTHPEKPVVITSIYRPGNKASPHYWWRAIDLRSWIYTERQIQAIVDFLNDVVLYDSSRTHFRTALYHNVGQCAKCGKKYGWMLGEKLWKECECGGEVKWGGFHLHVQVSLNNNTKLIK